MMMMTRVLMSRVDVDDSGVNGVHSDRVESDSNSNESGVDDAWC
jgi:hypothetical protein